MNQPKKTKSGHPNLALQVLTVSEYGLVAPGQKDRPVKSNARGAFWAFLFNTELQQDHYQKNL
jgi:hypothetical protein